MEHVIAYIALGANLGKRLETLRAAVRGLAAHTDISVLRASPVYETKAHTETPDETQPPYLNAVVKIETTLPPESLLAYCHDLERAAGRTRRARWAPRTLDLDLLLYDSERRATPELTLPHPRMAERRFVLQPLADLVAPAFYVPAPFDATVSDLLAACSDPDEPVRTEHVLVEQLPSTRKLTPNAEVPIRLPDDLSYMVIEGVIGAGKSTLARMLAEHFDGQLVLEEFEENPFLARFYEDRPRWAFQTQLAFLASRFQQQKNLLSRDLFHQVTISDYSFDKDRIFAHLNLSGDELQLYETLYSLMEPNTPRPDLVVYLQSTTERLMRNIRERGRAYEANMDPNYIAALNEAYSY
ncbi:MAG TPA: 2-amino-4-hydroxy-6-hydroxymethyldihydropteridine diphosphokinase, partial [Rhodothermales bacterium]|nr:2-amino-4-hydroxy-6-hydroxymethyldihydropteridine diphosphokinase [Rhodothermales bacterium]